MLKGLTWPQLVEWMAYDQLSPIGDKRGDWQAATIASSLWNVALSQGRSSRRVSTHEMLLEFTDEPKQAPKVQTDGGKTWQEMKVIAMMFAAQSRAGNRRKR